MKKYKLGMLEVTDRAEMERDEMIIEIIDRMQKYVAEAGKVAHDPTCDLEERYNGVRDISAYFCGLSNFLSGTLNIEVRNTSSKMLYTQEMFSRIYRHETMLKAELNKRKTGGTE